MRRYLAVLLLLLLLVVVTVIQYQSSVTAQQNQSLYVPVAVNPPTPTATATATATLVPSPTSSALVGTGVYKQMGQVTYSSYAGTMVFGFIQFVDGSPNNYGGPNGYRTIACWNGIGCFGPGFPVDSSGYYELSVTGPPAAPLRGSGYVYVVNGEDRRRVSNNYAFDTSSGTCVQVNFIECAQGDTSAQCTVTDGLAASNETTFVAREASPNVPLACR